MRTARLLSAVGICVALLMLGGCGNGNAVSAPNPAPIVALAANPTAITTGGSTTLTWSSSAATSVSIDQGMGSVTLGSGQATVKPAQTTTYTITATGAGGSTTASATVIVSATAPTTTTVAITANLGSVLSGGACTLTVLAANATSVVISNNVDSTTYALPGTGGTQIVNPSQTTTYKATATGADGSVTSTVTVTVTAAPTISITATPSSISSGAASTLAVAASNATSVVIRNNVDSTSYALPSMGGTQLVNPKQSTAYIATAVGPGGSVTATATITVTLAPANVTISTNPSSATVVAGQQQQFTSNDPDAIWSITPSTSGAITTNGLFTAGTVTGSVTVTAVDLAKNLSGVSMATVIAFAITPNPANVVAGATLSLTANAPATWVATSGNGSITNIATGSTTATYTAPNTASTATITATAATNNKINATDTVNVAALTVTPSTASTVGGRTQQFVANAAVTWVTSCGTIDSTGVFTAPNVVEACTITAAETGGATGTAIDHVTILSATPPSGVYTYKYDNGRTGLNPSETKLAVAAVTNGTNFGKLGSWVLDGNIYTQPLYVPSVSIQSVNYNVLYVSTENDSVYALNADLPGTVLWKRSFLTSAITTGQGYTGGRTSIGGNVGITGTPVIDPIRNWMYVVVRTTEVGNQVQRLHAIDITTGADVLAATPINPVVSGIGAGTDGNGNIPFLPLTQNQRPALLLDNGVVFVTFASFGDYDPYHGWMIAFDAATLNYIDAYNATPNGGGGGSWMAGAGPAGDSNGNVYFATGNGRPDATALFDPPNDLPNSLVKLKVTGGKLTVVDYFSPYNATCLSNDDLDLGSSGPTLIPDQFAGYSTLAIASKEGRAYLLDQNQLGKFHSGNDSQILSSVLFNPTACGQAGFDANAPMRVYGSPAYWNGNIYFGSAFGPLQQFSITSGKLGQSIQSAHIYQANGQLGRGPLVMVSANGAADAIVWTAENDLSGNGWLRAFDATNVANELYNSNFGGGSNFIIPMVSDGHVYVTGRATVYQYGLLH